MSIIELLAIIVIIAGILIHKFKCSHKWIKVDEKTLKCTKCGVLDCHHDWEEVERIRKRKNNASYERTIGFTIMRKCKYCNKIKTEFIRI